MITNPILPAPYNGTTTNGGVTFLGSAIPKAIMLGLLVGVVVFFFVFIVGAIQWISSGGDKQATESARNKVTSAIIGLLILFVVFAILRLINLFFGVSILNLTIPTVSAPPAS